MNDTRESSGNGDEAGGGAASAAVAPDELQRQRDEYYDLLLRKTAEFDNFRKRIDRERQTVSESASADLILELLPLVDDMERALSVEAVGEGAEAYRRGVELIHRQLLESLRKRGVRSIETLGADFDPHFHQAVAYERAHGRRDGAVNGHRPKNDYGSSLFAVSAADGLRWAASTGALGAAFPRYHPRWAWWMTSAVL